MGEKPGLFRSVSLETPLHIKILKRERRIAQLSGLTQTPKIQTKIDILQSELDELSATLNDINTHQKAALARLACINALAGHAANQPDSRSTVSPGQTPTSGIVLTTPQGTTAALDWNLSSDEINLDLADEEFLEL